MTVSMLSLMESLADLIANGYEVDPAFSMPFDFQRDTLYVWEDARSQPPAGTGEVIENFEIACVVVTDNEGETAIATRSRAVTERLDAWVQRALDEIRTKANVPPWDSGNIQAATDADYLRQLGVRGAMVRVTGYRYLD